VPGTADRLPNHEPLGKRTSVMRALASHCVAPAADPGDQHRIVADPSSEEPALTDESGRNADREIGT